jgi:serine/threonine protein kinase
VAEAQDDDRLMNLVDLALEQPPEERESWVRSKCGEDFELFARVWEYVQWDARIRGFLDQPLIRLATDASVFQPGDLLGGRFRILREVARGGMGLVYEARDEKLGRRIAIKAARPGFGTRLSPEALHTGTISHPNVCRTFEIHSAGGGAGEIDFLTMEFVEGETLADRLGRGRIPDKDASTIAEGIAAGLAEAHRHRIVHGDLKSNNVILGSTPDGGIRAVITDFGLAHRRAGEADGETEFEAAGTPDYMAPELWGGAEPSPSSDVFAFGVMLHEIATGARPGAGSAVSRHAGKWERIIARCLDADASRRYRDGGEVAAALSPAKALRWWLAAAAVIAAASVSVWIANYRASLPQETVRLAMLPLEQGTGAKSIAENITRAANERLALIQGGKRARLSFVSAEQTGRRNVRTPSAAASSFGATHVLHGAVLRDGDGFLVRAVLTDARTQADNASEEFHYGAKETGYAPQALAGMVTAALRLPPVDRPLINDEARKDFDEAFRYWRRNSTVDLALPALDRAVARDPSSALVWSGLAQTQWAKYFTSHDASWLQKSSESLEEARKRDPDVALEHVVAGRLAANGGFYEKAEKEYLRAIELNPGDADAHRRLGQVYERNDKLDEARAEFLRAVEVEPQYFTACQDLGEFYRNRGDLRGAALQFERCVPLAPGEPDAHRVLGIVYKDLGRYSDAERESRTAVGMAETADGLITLSIALMYQNRDGEAVRYLRRAAELAPRQSIVWFDLGRALRRSNSAAEANRAWQRGLESTEKEAARDPRDGAVTARLAYFCARLGNRRRAEAEMARALQLSPESSDARGTAVLTWEAMGNRDQSLAILNDSDNPVFEFVEHWPELADLAKDLRFQSLRDRKRITRGDGNGQ